MRGLVIDLSLIKNEIGSGMGGVGSGMARKIPLHFPPG